MAAKLVLEIFDENANRWEASAAFERFADFYTHASALRRADARARLSVVIQGDFRLTANELRRISDLGIKRS